MDRREFISVFGGALLSFCLGNTYTPELGDDKKVKRVYLTIDDGPTSNMRKIIDFLDENPEQKVTFFLLGRNLQNEENMRLAVEAVKKGHVVGSHSYSHPEFSDLSYEKALKEIKKGEQYIDWVYEGAGLKNPKLFRFPYGDKGNKKNKEFIQNYLNENEYTSFFWDVDTLDWQYYSGKRNLESVLKSVWSVSEGDVVLSHDFNKKGKMCTSVEIMKYFIEKGIISRHLESRHFPHTYLELPEPEKSKKPLVVVEGP